MHEAEKICPIVERDPAAHAAMCWRPRGGTSYSPFHRVKVIILLSTDLVDHTRRQMKLQVHDLKTSWQRISLSSELFLIPLDLNIG